MAFDQKFWSFVAGVGGTVVVFLFTLPSVFWILSHARESKPKSHIYEDKDGLSSEKATAAFSNTVPKLLLAFFAAAGISTSIALAVLSTVGEDHGMFIHNWLNVAQWVSTCDAICRKDPKMLTLLGPALLPGNCATIHSRLC